MTEQVMIYSISKSASENAKLLFNEQKYFYWNNEKFKNLTIGGFVFLINKNDKYVLFTKLDKINIKTTIDDLQKKTSFEDDGVKYIVDGIESNRSKWDNFVRFQILNKLEVSNNWNWTNLGAGGATYLNGDRINSDNSENRIKNINQFTIVRLNF